MYNFHHVSLDDSESESECNSSFCSSEEVSSDSDSSTVWQYALMFKAEIQKRTRDTLKMMFGGRLREIPKSLVQHIFGFLLQKHTAVSGVTFLRISMPITVRVLTQLHSDEDGAPIGDWIRYPYSLDSWRKNYVLEYIHGICWYHKCSSWSTSRTMNSVRKYMR